jgi:hypothetical protein
MKKKKNKEKGPKPNTGGHDRPFWKEIQKKKVRKQAQVILSFKIP